MTVPSPVIPSLLYTDVEDDLRATLRALLAERSPWQRVLARVDDPEHPYDDDLWKALAQDLGLTGLLVPEELGGAGATAREAALVQEELGRAVAPVPYLASAVVATTTLLGRAARPGGRAAAVLRELAEGTAVAAVVVTAAAAPHQAFPRTVTATATGEGAGLTLAGTVRHVLAADRADMLVVPVIVDGAAHLALVRNRTPGVTVTRRTSLDPTRPVADVTLDGAHGEVLADASTAEEDLRHGLTVGAALLASEQLGTADRALETAVEYLGTRHQFGRPIGSFQALRHRAADVWTEVNTARATVRYAAACAAEDSPDLAVATALAQAYVSDVAVRTCEECIQMHGGIGFTWEHPAHLYLKRAVSSAVVLGTSDQHHAEIGVLMALDGPGQS